MSDKPVKGLLSSLNTLPGFGNKLDSDIGDITRLLSDKACGDLNSAIDDVTSLANANKLLNVILSDTGGIFPALEGIAGIKNGVKSADTTECFGAVSMQVTEQMNTFLGRSPTRRKLLLLGVVDDIVGNASTTNSLLGQANSLNNFLSNLTSALEDAAGNSLLPDLMSNFTSPIENAGTIPH